MQLEVSHCTDEVLEFTMKGASTALANAVRRVGMGFVPVFGIDKTTFYENTSCMFDEYIAHRMGLVPLVTPEGYTPKEIVMFTLDKNGPGIIYSKAMKSSDSKVTVANDDIPIILLNKGETIRVEAQARLGIGREHARYQPGLISYEKTKDGEFNMFVESFGNMTAKELLNRTVDLMEEKMAALKVELKKAGKE